MPDTQQTDELRKAILVEFKQVLRLAPADYTENCTNVVMSLIDSYAEGKVREARIDELSKFTDRYDSEIEGWSLQGLNIEMTGHGALDIAASTVKRRLAQLTSTTQDKTGGSE
jgi:hypothetical protein